MSIVVFSHSDCLEHIPDEQHPECPARIAAINDQLIRSGMDFVLVRKDASDAPLEAIYRAHTKEHVDLFSRKFRSTTTSGLIRTP